MMKVRCEEWDVAQNLFCCHTLLTFALHQHPNRLHKEKIVALFTTVSSCPDYTLLFMWICTLIQLANVSQTVGGQLLKISCPGNHTAQGVREVQVLLLL